jgi:[acyl-carrier-protein] S-malonyltransferase
MGSDLVAEFAVARDIYARASEAVGFDLERLCFEDPNASLDQTRYTQPALLTHHMACLAVLSDLVGEPVSPMAAGGHSLGEYSALAAAGALSLETAVSLVAERGRLMSELGQGSMLATNLDVVGARQLAERHYCAVAGCNLPEQTVIAGTDEDLAALVADMKESLKGKRAIELKTEGAFHTYHMVGAALAFREVLERTEFGALEFGVLSNFTGEFHVDDAGSIRSRLFFQLFNPVRWTDCMRCAVDAGIDTVIEFGGGIGKGDGPAEKRPNLESVTKKSLIHLEIEAQYLPAINAASIRSAADKLTE